MDPISIALALGQIAPSLMRYFGVGDKPVAVAEAAIEVAKKVTGQPTGPDALEALRQNAQFAHDFQVAMLKADGELEHAYLADRQSARSRDVALRQSGASNLRADLMVFFAASGLVACLVVLTFFRDSIPGETVGVISTIAGIFGICLRDAFQFEFGSSRGSREKDTLLASKNNLS